MVQQTAAARTALSWPMVSALESRSPAVEPSAQTYAADERVRGPRGWQGGCSACDGHVSKHRGRGVGPSAGPVLHCPSC
eukprot:1040233-Prymnesium_polylepis.1